jgi:hypothetical protein
MELVKKYIESDNVVYEVLKSTKPTTSGKGKGWCTATVREAKLIQKGVHLIPTGNGKEFEQKKQFYVYSNTKNDIIELYPKYSNIIHSSVY